MLAIKFLYEYLEIYLRLNPKVLPVALELFLLISKPYPVFSCHSYGYNKIDKFFSKTKTY